MQFGDEMFARFEVTFPTPWVWQSTHVGDAEIQTIWRHGEVQAVASHEFDLDHQIRVTLLNPTSDDVEVPGPQCRIMTDWPVRRWLAGAHGYVFCRSPDGRQVLTISQRRGHCSETPSTNDDSNRSHLMALALTADQISASRDTGVLGAVVVHWQGQLSTERDIDVERPPTGLPPWSFGSATARAGEEIEADLPDVSLDTGAVHSHLVDTTVVFNGVAHQQIHVHDSRGTSTQSLWWAPSLDEQLRQHAERILGRIDPRRASSAQLWIVGRAVAHRAISLTAGVDEFLAVAAETVAAAQPVDALGLAGVVDEVLRTFDGELADGLRRSIQLRAGVGQSMATTALVLAGHQLGEPFAVPQVVPGAAASVTAVLSRAERDLIMGAGSSESAAVARVVSLLDDVLPGTLAEPLIRAQACAVVGLASESANARPDQRHRWSERLQLTRQRLLAEDVVDDVFGWLLW